MLHVYKATESSNKYLPPCSYYTKRHVFNNSLLRHLPVGLCNQGGMTVTQICVS